MEHAKNNRKKLKMVAKCQKSFVCMKWLTILVMQFLQLFEILFFLSNKGDINQRPVFLSIINNISF